MPPADDDDDDDVILVVDVKHRTRRRVVVDDDDDDDDNDCLPEPSHSATLSAAATASAGAGPSGAGGGGPSSSARPARALGHSGRADRPPHDYILEGAPRRSARVRSQTNRFSALRHASGDHAEEEEDDDPDENDRLEQIDCQTASALGLPASHPASRTRIVMHPVAMALISFHAHLTRTEIIGYLGGVVRRTDDGVHILIAEAFPAQGLCERALRQSGRNAFTEVEIDPESSVEVMNRMMDKRLQVVGWYHSHPDASFTVEPSRVDIENQNNYQQLIFKDTPFVAGIIAPYNSDLPNHMPEVQFFQVHEDIPVIVPYTIGRLGAEGLESYAYGDERFPVDDFVAESVALIAMYWQFAKRARLDREWRDGVMGLDKLRLALMDVVADDANGVCIVAEQCKQCFLESVDLIMDNVERRWKESGLVDDEKRERTRQAAIKRRKKSRRR